MYEVLILPIATRDIEEASKWYNQKQDGLGKRFTRAVRKTIGQIRNNPLSSAVRYNDVRTAIIEVFPFMIHYSISEATKTIIVLAVFHTSLNSEGWASRSGS